MLCCLCNFFMYWHIKCQTSGTAADKLRFVQLYALSVESLSCWETKLVYFLLLFVIAILQSGRAVELSPAFHHGDPGSILCLWPTYGICGEQRGPGTCFSLSLACHKCCILVFNCLPQTLHCERASFPEVQQRGRGADQPSPRVAFISCCRVTFTITIDFTYLSN